MNKATPQPQQEFEVELEIESMDKFKNSVLPQQESLQVPELTEEQLKTALQDIEEQIFDVPEGNFSNKRKFVIKLIESYYLDLLATELALQRRELATEIEKLEFYSVLSNPREAGIQNSAVEVFRLQVLALLQKETI